MLLHVHNAMRHLPSDDVLVQIRSLPPRLSLPLRELLANL